MFGKPGRRTRAAACGVAAASACVVLAACSPVKIGAAAVVGNQRITVAELDTQVSNLQAAVKPYAGQVALPAADMPAEVLSWLIRFQIGDQLAASSGISPVTTADVQKGTADIMQQAEQVAAQDGLSSAKVALLDAGISPQMLDDLGRYQAQSLAFAIAANGGKLPTTAAEGNAATAALNKARCTAAKSLSIEVSPQFGRLDYSQYAVVPVPNTLSQPAGTPSPTATTGLAPAC